MAYGLNIKNTSNEIQVDGEYRNLSIVTSGTWSMGSTSYGARKYFGVTTVEPPVVAIQPQSVLCVSHRLYTNSSGEYDSCYVYSASSHNLPYIVLNEPNASELPTTEYGLAVYDSSGNLAFHNSNRWMRLIDIHPFPNPWATDCTAAEGTSTDVTVNDTNNNYFLLRPQVERGLCDTSTDCSAAGLTMKAIDSTTMRVEVEWLFQHEAGSIYRYHCDADTQLIEIGT